LRIVLASEYFYPQTRGGTEMYVYQLAKQLIAHGHECIVLSLSNDFKESLFEDIPIIYISYNKTEYQESNDPSNLHELVSTLDSINPDVFHLHTLSPALGTSHIVHLHKIGYKTVFTTHLPNFLCTRGDLLFKGIEACDGVVSYGKCMECVLHTNGYENSIMQDILITFSKNNVITYFLPTLANVKNKIRFIENFKIDIDFVIAVSQWQKDLLIINGFDENKVSLCRQSINEDFILTQRKNKSEASLNIGYVGRIVEEKGFHLLLDTLENIDNANYKLNIAAIKSEHQLSYYKENKAKALKLNCTWNENLNAEEVITFIDELDLLVVPSTWLETGPYVIYEALARKVPVLAFNRGGSVELIKNNVDSILVNTEIEFKQQLQKLIDNPIKLKELSNQIQLSRTTRELYLEMMNVYNKLIVQ
jgi:glycosyltransferase involved in cell wall biosynthesis